MSALANERTNEPSIDSTRMSAERRREGTGFSSPHVGHSSSPVGCQNVECNASERAREGGRPAGRTDGGTDGHADVDVERRTNIRTVCLSYRCIVGSLDRQYRKSVFLPTEHCNIHLNTYAFNVVASDVYSLLTQADRPH